MIELQPESVHCDAFSAFGQVLLGDDSVPLMDSPEATYWGRIAEFGFPNSVSSGFLKTRRRDPLVDRLERHVKTPEILVALAGDGVICMATPESNVGTDDVRLGVFLLRRGEAIKMHTGTWHWLPVPYECDETHYLVLFARHTEDRDLEVVPLSRVVRIRTD